MNSTNIDSDLNESISSKSNPGEITENTNLDISHQTTNTRSTPATPAVLNTNTSRTSISTNVGQSSTQPMSGRLSLIIEQRRSPDLLLKKWIKNQKIITIKPDESSSLTVS